MLKEDNKTTKFSVVKTYFWQYCKLQAPAWAAIVPVMIGYGMLVDPCSFGKCFSSWDRLVQLIAALVLVVIGVVLSLRCDWLAETDNQPVSIQSYERRALYDRH